MSRKGTLSLSVISSVFAAFTLLCALTTSHPMNKPENSQLVLKPICSQTSSAQDIKNIRYSAVKSTTPVDGGIWGGYIVQSQNIKGVSGNFNVVNSINGWDAAWTGIGGFNGQNLAQTGVDMNLMKAWYELFPAPPEYVFDVKEFDKMYSAVNYNENTGKWNLIIKDLTNGKSFSKEFDFNPDQTTAEWVMEKIGDNPIGNFETVNFSKCIWLDKSNRTQSINSLEDKILNLSALYGKDKIISPSKIGADGKSFSITAD